MTQPTEITARRVQEGEISPERRLAGKTAIITGGSRDVGAGIVEALAREGVVIASSFRDERKQKRADAVFQRVADFGGDLTFIREDLSSTEGRQNFSAQALESLGGKVDFLVLNTSGDSAALNEELSAELLDRIMPHMNEGGVIVRLQSVPGKFAPQLEGLGKTIALYEEVAPYKYEDLRALRKRIDEMKERGIRFIEVTPPVVKIRGADGKADEVTSNMKLFNFAAKRETGDKEMTAERMHDELSDKLGLPRVVYTDQIGDRIAEIFLNPDVPTGYTEFFNGVMDAQDALENWYGTPDTVGIQTLQRADIMGMPVGVGRSIVSLEQVEYPRNLPMVDSVEVDEQGNMVGKVIVTPEKARGHLNTQNGLPLIFPGHKQIRAAVETIQAIEREKGNGFFSRLKGFDLAQFLSPVLADGSHTLTVMPELVKRTRGGAVYNINIVNEEGVQTTSITNLAVFYMHDEDPKVLPEDFIIEAAAQTAGAALLSPESLSKEILPLFGQVGPVEFTGSMLKPGAGVEYYAVGEGTDKGIDAKVVRVISDGQDIAKIEGVKAVVSKTKVMKRILKF